MTLVKWTPRPINMYNEFDDILNSLFFSDFRDSHYTSKDWEPKMDIKESDNDFTIKADIAGLSKDDININLNGDRLTISGEREDESSTDTRYHFRERSVGKFSRTFNLPESVNKDEINARFENGILSIDLKKREEIIPKTKEIVIR